MMRRRHAPAFYPTGPERVRAAGPLGRWLWPVGAVGGFLALTGYVLDHDHGPGPGLSDRGLLTVALAAAVLVILTVRRAAGGRALLRTLTEYAAVAVLAVSLVTLSGPTDQPARSPAGEASGRSGLAVLVEAPGNVRDWLADRWQQAGQKVSQRTRSTPPPAEEASP